METKVIIFTTRAICDPTPFIWEGHNKVLEKYGAKFTQEEINSMKGASLKEQLKIANKKFNLNLEYEPFSEDSREIAKELIIKNLKPFTGIIELLQDLKSQGIKLVLASQNIKLNLDLYLKTMNLENCFDKIVSVEEITEFLPNPQLLEISCKKINENAKDCIYIDPKANSLKAADRINMKSILFKDTTQLKKELQKLL